MSGAPSGDGHPDGEGSHLAERGLWLTRLRWIAVCGVLVVVILAHHFRWVATTAPLFGIVALIVAYNLAFWWWSKAGHLRASSEVGERVLFLQISCDLGALTLLVHWSGGIDNPFIAFFAFHMAIGAMLLGRSSAYLLGASASLLLGGTLVAEHFGLIPRHPLLVSSGHLGAGSASNSVPLVVGHLVAFTLMLIGVIYFVQSVESQRRRAEARARERERVALSRERMARIGELSAGVSHTVRNPLHGVMNCVDILRQETSTEDESTAEILDLMSDGLARIESVTRRLLTLSHDRALRRGPTDLNELIRESTRFVGSRGSVRRLDIQCQLEELPPLDLDADRISEVLINLLDNAAHACRNGGEVTVRTSQLADGSDRVSIVVEDSGEGIDEQKLPMIFDPFFTTKDIGEGSGLGLAIARSVVEEHDGTIDVTSSPGSGTRFQILLPTRGAALDEEQENPR